VESECTSHIFGSFPIVLPKIIEICGNLTKFWQKQICLVFFGTRCMCVWSDLVTLLFTSPYKLLHNHRTQCVTRTYSLIHNLRFFTTTAMKCSTRTASSAPSLTPLEWTDFECDGARSYGGFCRLCNHPITHLGRTYWNDLGETFFTVIEKKFALSSTSSGTSATCSLQFIRVYFCSRCRTTPIFELEVDHNSLSVVMKMTDCDTVASIWLTRTSQKYDWRNNKWINNYHN